MAIRAQFRGMSWPPAPNPELKEAETTTTTSQPDWQKMVIPGALVVIGAGLLVASQYVFTPAPSTDPTTLPSGVLVTPYGLVIPRPYGLHRPPMVMVKPSPGTKIMTSDKATAAPSAYGYGYSIPETTKAQIMAMAPAMGKNDPFVTLLPKKGVATPPPPPPTPAPLAKLPAPPARIALPGTPPLETHKKPSIKKPTTLANSGPLVISPDDITVQGVLTSDDSGESMVILNVHNELQTYRVGDMIVLNGKRLWVQAIDEARLVVTIKDATGRRVQLKADTG